MNNKNKEFSDLMAKIRLMKPGDKIPVLWNVCEYLSKNSHITRVEYCLQIECHKVWYSSQYRYSYIHTLFSGIEETLKNARKKLKLHECYSYKYETLYKLLDYINSHVNDDKPVEEEKLDRLFNKFHSISKKECEEYSKNYNMKFDIVIIEDLIKFIEKGSEMLPNMKELLQDYKTRINS